MKRYSAIITLALLGLLISAPAVQAGRASSPFDGTWIGQEPLPPAGDGSWQHLVVKGTANMRIDYQDEFGQACWDAGATDFWFSSSLRGSVSGSALTGVYRSAKCGHLSLTAMRGTTHSWTIDTKGNANPADDTLSDGFVTFNRV
jgi:hypothetical protein